jgi:hypothetical protein
MLYRHEKPCFQRKKARVESSLATTILHIQCSSFIWFASTIQNVPTALRSKLETFPFLLILLGVSCLSAQNMFMSIQYMSWPWDTRSSYRSIVSELLSFLSCGKAKFSKEENKAIHDDITDQPLKDRRSSWAHEDHRRLVTPSFFSYLGISGSRFL